MRGLGSFALRTMPPLELVSSMTNADLAGSMAPAHHGVIAHVDVLWQRPLNFRVQVPKCGVGHQTYSLFVSPTDIDARNLKQLLYAKDAHDKLIHHAIYLVWHGIVWCCTYVLYGIVCIVCIACIVCTACMVCIAYCMYAGIAP